MTTLVLDILLGLGWCAVLIVCWVLTIVGLPGNWLIVALAAMIAFFTPADWRLDMGVATLGALLLLALAGEVVEFAAGSVTTTRAGGSRRSALLAIVGAVAGGLLGAVIGLPVPLVGSMLAAVLFAAVGACVGAIGGELHAGRGAAKSWRVGQAAFQGRLLGTVGKAILGAAMVVVATIAALV